MATVMIPYLEHLRIFYDAQDATAYVGNDYASRNWRGM